VHRKDPVTVIGVFLGWIGLGPILAMAPSSLPRLEHARIDLPVLAFAMGLCLITTLFCAIVPAMRASAHAGRDPRLRVRSGGGPRPPVGRGLLTAVQIASATVLLTGAGLVVRSFDQLRQIDLGFEPSTS
jgi:putative ABC transport system permease protein